MRASSTRTVLASFAVVLAGSVSALAADAQAFGNRLKEIATAGYVPVNFASAEASGDDVVLKGVTAGAGDDAVNVGDVRFEGVTGSDAEGWKVARIPFADIDTTDDGKRLQVQGMAISGLQIAAKGGVSSLPGESPYFFDSAAVQSVQVSEGSTPFLTVGTTSFVNTVATDGQIDSNFTLGDMDVDFQAAGDDDAAKTMTEIGYPRLSGNGSMKMGWNPKTGDVNVDPFTLDFENAGKFDLDYKIGGYTPAFAKSLADIQSQMATNPDAAQSSGMAIIGLLSQLSVGSLNIGFTDASLTGKLLDYYAKQNGQSRDELVNGISQMAPQMLASLNNAEFQTQVSDAVSTFLRDPKSLRIAINPAQPIPATQILGAAMGAPQTLPGVLQLKVTANDG